MSIEPATVNSLNLKIATKTNFSFQIRKKRAAIGARLPARRRRWSAA